MKTATGKSLSLYQAPHLEITLFAENIKGLPELYNLAIDKFKNEPSILVFAHDDISILDFYWMNSIFNGLSHFGIVGIAGNIRRVPYQPSWAFVDKQFTWDKSENLSGVVGHGSRFPPENLDFFAPPFQEVKLLDGVLLAAFSETLVKNHMRFDEKFKFHFYDMDFCRQAEIRGIKMGTIPLSLIHESAGSFGSGGWSNSYADYLKKWGQ
nr:glycosyltransferase [Polynucleobacter sp. MG-27-Goln-C1]